MPQCDYTPRPYNGPSREEVLATRQKFANPAIFLEKSYDEKVALARSLYRPITGAMIAAELERYFSSEQRYADDARVQRAERVAAELEAQLAARDLVAKRAGSE